MVGFYSLTLRRDFFHINYCVYICNLFFMYLLLLLFQQIAGSLSVSFLLVVLMLHDSTFSHYGLSFYPVDFGIISRTLSFSLCDDFVVKSVVHSNNSTFHSLLCTWFHIFLFSFLFLLYFCLLKVRLLLYRFGAALLKNQRHDACLCVCKIHNRKKISHVEVNGCFGSWLLYDVLIFHPNFLYFLPRSC